MKFIILIITITTIVTATFIGSNFMKTAISLNNSSMIADAGGYLLMIGYFNGVITVISGYFMFFHHLMRRK